MRLSPIRIAAPAESPVSLAEIKAHLRVDFSDEDSILDLYRQAAIAHFDGWSGILGRCLISQGWRVDLPAFPCGAIALPFPDISAASIAYSDADDVERTFSAASWRLLHARGGAVISLKDGEAWPSTYPRPDAVRVSFTAGYGGAATDIPAPIRSAILLRAGDLYTRREDATKPGGLVDMLIAPYCRTHIGAG